MPSLSLEKLPYLSSFVDRHGRRRWRVRRGRMTIPLPGAPSTAEYREAYDRAVAFASYARKPKSARLPAPKKSSDAIISSAICSSYKSAKKRSRESGKSFSITIDEVQGLAAQQLNRCALTGIHFQAGKTQAGTRNPLAPSIDRIDCSKGYEITNIRLVLHSVNVALNLWGDDHFLQICLGRAKMAG